MVVLVSNCCGHLDPGRLLAGAWGERNRAEPTELDGRVPDGERAPLVLEHELRVGRRVDDHQPHGLGLVAVGHDVVGDDGELREGFGDARVQIPQVQEDVGRAVDCP